MYFFFFLKERELAERRMEEEMEAFKRQIIEEERQKLLKEHAMRLLGYLPKVWTKYKGKIACWRKGGGFKLYHTLFQHLSS